MAAPLHDFVAELEWRGLIHQSTDLPVLRAHLANPTTTPRTAYVGLDPTADSLTIGNLVGILALVRFQLAGHKPIVVVGGGTGMIGDPSGKSKERELMTLDRVEANVRGQTRIYHAVWKNAAEITAAPLGSPPIRNNHDWLGKISYLEALRDIGKFFSVNMMIQKESVKERLHNRDQGISYTEFSYMILQAYDYFHLWKHNNVTLQMGGSDQWGNIICGMDLIQRDVAADAEAKGIADAPRADTHALTWPLVTKADGGKFGKSETGAVWLTADRTSAYAFYQFWLNSADADVVKFLKIFTLLPREQVAALEAAHAANPGAREAHRALARHVTQLLHGRDEMELAEKAGKALFSGEVADLPEHVFTEVLAAAPSTNHDKTAFQQGSGVSIVDLLVQTGLTASRGQAKEALSTGSVSINGQKVDPNRVVTAADLLHGRFIALRRGKKNWHLARWTELSGSQSANFDPGLSRSIYPSASAGLDGSAVTDTREKTEPYEPPSQQIDKTN
jgi:tyrosyl-tRNA synthetase